MSGSGAAENAIRSVVKLIVAVIGLLLLRVTIGLLPGGDRELPGIGVAIDSLLIAGFAFLIAGIIFYYAHQLRETTVNSSYSNQELRKAGGRVILGVAGFVGLIAIYDGLDRIVEQVTTETSTVPLLFDTAFLVAALLIILVLGYTVLQNLDPFIDSLVEGITGGIIIPGTASGESGSKSGQNTSGGKSAADCPNCGSRYPGGASFCADCGTQLSN